MNHARVRRWTAGAVVTTLLGGLLTLLVVSPAQANHGDQTLQVTREFTTTAKGGSLTLTARIPNANTSGSAINVDFEIEGGPVEGDDSPLSPDRSCDIAVATMSCTTTAISSAASGTGLVRAWIDHDKSNASVEADPDEGRLADDTPFVPIANTAADCRDNPLTPEAEDTAYEDCANDTAEPGRTDEPDTTDVVSIGFSDAPDRIDCFDSNPANGSDTEVNARDENETITCVVYDTSGNRVADEQIDGENLDGENDPDDGATSPPDYDTTTLQIPPADACTTGSSGSCSVVIDAETEGQVGDANICFWRDTDDDEVYGADVADGGECGEDATPDDGDDADVVRISWATGAPVATSVDLNPEHLLAAAGSSPSVTATVYDQFGDKFVGTTSVSAELFSGSAGDADGNAMPRDLVCSTSNSDSCSLPVRSATSGSARLCGWIGSAPTLAGDASNGTCNGEGLDDGALNGVDVTRITWGAAATTTTSTPGGGGGGGGSAAQGYSLVGADGSLYAFGTAKNFGDMKGTALTKPIIGVAYTPGGNGYWLVAEDGGIFSFGDADFWGSMGDQKINSPVLGMAATPTGKGYWLFAGDGGIFSFGDAAFFGSMGDQKLNQPVINMEPIASGGGYWLVAADGGIFSFGSAEFQGSMGDQKINQPVFDMTSTDTDKGYWLVARDGGVFSFGDAGPKFYGNPVEDTNPKPTRIIGMDSTPTSTGYWIADANGKVWNYGNAQALGDRYQAANPAPMIGFASVPGAKP